MARALKDLLARAIHYLLRGHRIPFELCLEIAEYVPSNDRINVIKAGSGALSFTEEEFIALEQALTEVEPEQYFCSQCARILNMCYFSDSQISSTKRKGHKNAAKRFCIECGLKDAHKGKGYSAGCSIYIRGEHYCWCLRCSELGEFGGVEIVEHSPFTARHREDHEQHDVRRRKGGICRTCAATTTAQQQSPSQAATGAQATSNSPSYTSNPMPAKGTVRPFEAGEPTRRLLDNITSEEQLLDEQGDDFGRTARRRQRNIEEDAHGDPYDSGRLRTLQTPARFQRFSQKGHLPKEEV